MRKILLLLAMIFSIALNAQEQVPFVKKAVPAQTAAPKLLPASGDFEMTYCPGAVYYEASTPCNYYMILSSFDAKFDASSGAVTPVEATNGWVVALDFYADPTSPIALPAGTYKPSLDAENITFNPDYSALYYYEGENVDMVDLSGDVEVSYAEDGDLVVKFKGTYRKNTYTFTYKGQPTYKRKSTVNSPYPLIGKDLDLNFTGALGCYMGDLFQSKTGNIALNLYDCEFDRETGAHTGVGHCLQINLFNTLFGDFKEAHVKPGTYKVAKNFQRWTYYPGTVVDYMGTTIVMGSFVQQRFETMDIAVCYIADGTVEVSIDEDSVYTVVVDLRTDDDYTVKGTYKGRINLIDNSVDTPEGAIISTLTQDYELDLNQIPRARLWKDEDIMGYGRFYLDIGSPSGLDQEIVDNGGDIFRLNFITELGAAAPPSGTYSVMEENWDYYIGLFKSMKGYFHNGGDLTGTRWYHFAEGRYLVADGLAPAYAGSFDYKWVEGDTYAVDINVFDDAGYNITGKWSGQVLPQFELPAGIGSLEQAPTYTYLDKETLLLGFVKPADQVNVYDMSGKKVWSKLGATKVSLKDMPKGVYVVKVGTCEPIKMIKR